MNTVYYPPQTVMGQPFVLIDPQKVCSLTNNLNNLSLSNAPPTNTQYINLAQYPPPTATFSAPSGSQPMTQSETYGSSLAPYPVTNTNTPYGDQQNQTALRYQQQQMQQQFLHPQAYYVHIPNPNDNPQQLVSPSPLYVSFMPPVLNHVPFAPVTNMDQMNHQQQQHQLLKSSNNSNNNNTTVNPPSKPVNQQYQYSHNMTPLPHMQQIQTGGVSSNTVQIKMNQSQIQPMQQQMPYNQHYHHNYGSNYQATNQFSPSSAPAKSSQNQIGSTSFNFRKKSCFNCRSQSHVAADCTKPYSSMHQQQTC